jgi:hypothetical protein
MDGWRDPLQALRAYDMARTSAPDGWQFAASGPGLFGALADYSSAFDGSLGDLADLETPRLTENAYRLKVEARDNVPFQPDVDDEGNSRPLLDSPGAGMLDIVIRLDGQTVSTSAVACLADPACEQARAWDWDTTGAANGEHTVTVTAVDRVGNEYVDEFTVDLQRVFDQPARTNTTVRRTILGAALGDGAGTAVAALGDVNGDGYADYGVGAPGAAGSAGTAYLVLGSQDASTIDLASPGDATRRLLGDASGRYCGTSIAAAGDINGDDLDDFLVGCPGLDTKLGSLTATTGVVYAIFGSADPQNLNLVNVGSPGFESTGFAISGPSDTAGIGLPLLQSRPAVFGERLQSAPLNATHFAQDVNGDGLADIIIGDSAANGGAGSTYVIYGKTDSGGVSALSLGDRGFAVVGDRANGLAGYSAALAGDLDGDTLADVVIGAPGRTPADGGRAYLVNGSVDDSDVDLAQPGARALTLTSGQPDDRFGVNVTAMADTNVDDRDDIAIGTASGAYVLSTVPTASRQVSADDG